MSEKRLKRTILIIIAVCVIVSVGAVGAKDDICFLIGDFDLNLNLNTTANNTEWFGGHLPAYYLAPAAGYPGDVFVNETGDVMTGDLNTSAMILAQDDIRAYSGAGYVNITAATGYINTSRGIHIGERVGIGTATPDSIFHIKANIVGTIGSHSAGQIIIQNPADTVFSNVVITAYESDGSGNPDQQLWYLGSSSTGNSDIIFLNRRNSKLALGTNGITQMTILGNGNVGIGTTNPSSLLTVNSGANFFNATTSGNIYWSGAAYGQLGAGNITEQGLINTSYSNPTVIYDANTSSFGGGITDAFVAAFVNKTGDVMTGDLNISTGDSFLNLSADGTINTTIRRGAGGREYGIMLDMMGAAEAFGLNIRVNDTTSFAYGIDSRVNTSGNVAMGIYGYAEGEASTNQIVGIMGETWGADNPLSYGVWGWADGSADNRGIMGETGENGPVGAVFWAGYFRNGNVMVEDTLHVKTSATIYSGTGYVNITAATGNIEWTGVISGDVGWGNLTNVPDQIANNYTNDTIWFGGHLPSYYASANITYSEPTYLYDANESSLNVNGSVYANYSTWAANVIGGITIADNYTNKSDYLGPNLPAYYLDWTNFANIPDWVANNYTAWSNVGDKPAHISGNYTNDTVWFSGQQPAYYLDDTTHDVGFALTAAFVNITGDTMTGNLTVPWTLGNLVWSYLRELPDWIANNYTGWSNIGEIPDAATFGDIFVNESGDTMTGNLTIPAGVDMATVICLNAACTRHIYDNGTHVIIQG